MKTLYRSGIQIIGLVIMLCSCTNNVIKFSNDDFGEEIQPGIYVNKNGEDMFSGPRVIVQISDTESNNQFSSCFTFKNAPIKGTVINGELSKIKGISRVIYSGKFGMT